MLSDDAAEVALPDEETLVGVLGAVPADAPCEPQRLATGAAPPGGWELPSGPLLLARLPCEVATWRPKAMRLGVCAELPVGVEGGEGLVPGADGSLLLLLSCTNLRSKVHSKVVRCCCKALERGADLDGQHSRPGSEDAASHLCCWLPQAKLYLPLGSSCCGPGQARAASCHSRSGFGDSA